MIGKLYGVDSSLKMSSFFSRKKISHLQKLTSLDFINESYRCRFKLLFLFLVQYLNV